MCDPFLSPYADIEKLRRRAREILGVPKQAGPEEVKKAFHDLARRSHPDVTRDRTGFTRVVNAYLILTRPDPRGYSLDPDPEAVLEVPEGMEEYFEWWKGRFFR